MRLNHQAPQEEKDRAAVKADAMLQQLQSMRPAQIETYIENNVTSLASAKQILKVLAKAVALLARNL